MKITIKKLESGYLLSYSSEEIKKLLPDNTELVMDPQKIEKAYTTFQEVEQAVKSLRKLYSIDLICALCKKHMEKKNAYEFTKHFDSVGEEQ